MSIISAVTHNGNFHADDVISYLVLTQSLKPIEIDLIRTRNPTTIENASIVFDVGGVYDEKKYRFDHHFNDTKLIRESGIKYSSAGLIWKHYGLMFLETKYSDYGFSDKELFRLWESIDKRIFEWLDRVDNGQVEEGKLPKNCITINGMVNSFVPIWNTNETFDEAFFKAAKWTDMWLNNEIGRIVGQINAEQLVLKDFENRPFDRILVMDDFKPWQKTIFENDIATKLDYVVFYDKSNDDWKIQCVPTKEGSFEIKRPLPAEWGGLSGQDLSNLTNIEMIFCHPSQFIGGFKYKKDLQKLINILYN